MSEKHTHTFNYIFDYRRWKRLAYETWNPKCESCHSSVLARNTNRKSSSKTSQPLTTLPLARLLWGLKSWLYSLRNSWGWHFASLGLLPTLDNGPEMICHSVPDQNFKSRNPAPDKKQKICTPSMLLSCVWLFFDYVKYLSLIENSQGLWEIINPVSVRLK